MEVLSFSYFIWVIIILIAVGGWVTYMSGKLTLAASVTGVVIALLIYLGAGLPGLVMLTVFLFSRRLQHLIKKITN